MKKLNLSLEDTIYERNEKIINIYEKLHAT